MSWLARLIRRGQASPPQADPPEAEEPPEWAAVLIEASQKVARSQARAAARVEALESKLEGGFADLRAAVADGRPAAPAGFDPLLDALDILDEARRALAAAGAGPIEQGLTGVSERLERFLAESGVSRRAVASEPLDGRLFRVVGTVERTDMPDGATAEVVRAAALAGGRVVREGEVLINRRPST